MYQRDWKGHSESSHSWCRMGTGIEWNGSGTCHLQQDSLPIELNIPNTI